MAEGNWQTIKLLEINRWENDKKPGTGREIRLVQYVLDGVSKTVKLECGEFYLHQQTGEERFKAKGFTKADLERCKAHWPKIMELMTSPPPVAAQAAGAGPAESIEEVPF